MAVPTASDLQILPPFETLLQQLVNILDNEAKIPLADRLLSTDNIDNLNDEIAKVLSQIDTIIDPTGI